MEFFVAGPENTTRGSNAVLCKASYDKTIIDVTIVSLISLADAFPFNMFYCDSNCVDSHDGFLPSPSCPVYKVQIDNCPHIVLSTCG